MVITNILMIDTADDHLKVSLKINKKEIDKNKKEKYKHIESLLPAIDECFKNIGQDKKELKYIGVCEGPGSFTGIRIGISAALGIAFSSDIKCFGFSVFDVYKFLFNDKEDLVIIPIIDARKNRYYCAFILREKDFEYFDISLDEIIKRCKEYKDKEIIFVGKDFKKIKVQIKGKFEFSQMYSEGYGSKEILGYSKYCIENKLFNKTPKPIYLRKSEAEISLIKKIENKA